MTKSALIIFNSLSKKNYFHSSLSQLVYDLTSEEYLIEIYATQSQNDCYETIKNYKKIDLLVCAGGDGTLNEVVNAIHHKSHKPRILYFPTGTVNDFAYSLGIKKNYDYIMKLFKTDRFSVVDTGVINNECFNYVCAIGNFTSSSYTLDQKTKNFWGSNAYFINGLKNLGKTMDKFNIKANIDGESIEGIFQYVLIVNSTSIAGFRNMFPNNSLDDGKFQILLVKKDPGGSIIEVPRILIEGIKDNIPASLAIMREFRELNIEIEQEVTWTKDGERGPVGNIDVSVINKNIEIYCSIE